MPDPSSHKPTNNGKLQRKQQLAVTSFEPRCLATTLGSLPNTDVSRGTRLMFASTPEIPSWVQFPKRDFHENMMVQFTEGLPGLVEADDRVTFDSSAPDFVDQLTDFYTQYLAVTEEGDTSALRIIQPIQGVRARFLRIYRPSLRYVCSPCDAERPGHRTLHPGNQPARPGPPLQLL